MCTKDLYSNIYFNFCLSRLLVNALKKISCTRHFPELLNIYMLNAMCAYLFQQVLFLSRICIFRVFSFFLFFIRKLFLDAIMARIKCELSGNQRRSHHHFVVINVDDVARRKSYIFSLRRLPRGAMHLPAPRML